MCYFTVIFRKTLTSSAQLIPPSTTWPPFSNVCSWIKNFVFWFELHWSLFLRVQLAINEHWFGWQFGAYSVPNHYLNQWRSSSPTHICGIRGRWVLFFTLVWQNRRFTINMRGYLKWNYQTMKIFSWVDFHLNCLGSLDHSRCIYTCDISRHHRKMTCLRLAIEKLIILSFILVQKNL